MIEDRSQPGGRRVAVFAGGRISGCRMGGTAGGVVVRNVATRAVAVDSRVVEDGARPGCRSMEVLAVG